MAVAVSVIVPAYRASATLDACLRSVLDQDFDEPYEVVLVASADRDDDLPALPKDSRLRAELVVPRLAAATARNRAVERARGALLAFTDADVVVDRSWLRELVAASDGGRMCVAGAVRNGTPHSIVGTAEYLVQFLDLHPRRPAASAWHGATANLLLGRDLFERLGHFPEDMGGGEDTLLTGEARARGQFVFGPRAVVTHLNRTTLADVVRHQYEFGRFTAELVTRARYYRASRLVSVRWLLPLAVIARLIAIYCRVARWDVRLLPRSLAAVPAVLAALVAWARGVAGAPVTARGEASIART